MPVKVRSFQLKMDIELLNIGLTSFSYYYAVGHLFILSVESLWIYKGFSTGTFLFLPSKSCTLVKLQSEGSLQNSSVLRVS